MADLSQHSNYTGRYSGLLDNLYLTLAIGAVCLVGHELEIRVKRRRGHEGTKIGYWKWLYLICFRHSSSNHKRKGDRKEEGDAGRDGRNGQTHGEAVKEVRDGSRSNSGSRSSGDDNDDEVHVVIKGEKGGEADKEVQKGEKRMEERREKVGDREKWEFGYIYQPKTWAKYHSPPVPKWPLQWIWETQKLRESDMPPIWGLDLTLHLRFLRGALCYTLMQSLIILPIIMPLHILYAPASIADTSMLRAGISSLVESSGGRWLWVHGLLIWYITVSWLGWVTWIVWGGIGYRKREIGRLRLKVEEIRKNGNGNRNGRKEIDNEVNGVNGSEVEKTDERGNGEMNGNGVDNDRDDQLDGKALEAELHDESEGVKRFRTIMVLNVPPDMRSEETLENYFNHRIHRYYQRKLVRQQKAEGKITTIVKKAESPLPLGLASIRPRLLMKRKPEKGIEAGMTDVESPLDKLGPSAARRTTSPVDVEKASPVIGTAPKVISGGGATSAGSTTPSAPPGIAHVRSSSFRENGRPVVLPPVTPHAISLHSLPSIHSPILHPPAIVGKSSPTHLTTSSKLPSPSADSSNPKLPPARSASPSPSKVDSPNPYTLNQIPTIKSQTAQDDLATSPQQTNQEHGGSDFFTTVDKAKKTTTTHSAVINGHDSSNKGVNGTALQEDLVRQYGYDGMIHIDGEDEGQDEDDLYVDEVVLVRKLGTVISLRERRIKVLKDLEIAHVKLAQRVLNAVSKHKKSLKSEPDTEGLRKLPDEAEHDEMISKAEKGNLGELSKKGRLDILTKALGHFIDDEPAQLGHDTQTIWQVLHSLDRRLLDPYQALTHLRLTTKFRKANAPLIDYLTTKLRYLTLLLEDAREKPLEEYSKSSAAFVTFKDARTARLALRILKNHPQRPLACKTQAAPAWAELLWPRLGLSVYRSEFVRNWVVFLGVWAFTIAWIFPVSLLCALTSLSNIAGFLPPLKAWLDYNPKAASAITSLAPVILVALLTITICPILLVIANKAETIVTRLGIHNSVLERFWKFLMVNGVVFFAIGQSAIEAYLTAFETNDYNPLPIIASAFPTAAPYFASYILLQVAIQPCFEIFRFGLPTIVYWFGTKWSSIPRQRNSRTEYPTFSHFSQLPYQLLAGAIMHLFMLLNPLVIPFTLIYYAICYVVWKRQFTFVYGRLYENNGRRSCIRILRYSLDALALGQFVLFAFFVLNYAKGSAIATGILFALTLLIKLYITRAVKQRFDNLDIEEGDILCPPIASASESAKTSGSVADRVAEDDDEKPGIEYPPSSLRLYSKWDLFLLKFFATVHKWAYDQNAKLPPGYVKPVPFDWAFFKWLDRIYTWKIDEPKKLDGFRHAPEVQSTPEPSKGISNGLDIVSLENEIVVPHHKLIPWEDIPPYYEARGYSDQPAYTDDFDDFLWLPRDPLSNLDLDDTVEMRVSLTSSSGGDGILATPQDEEGEETLADVVDPNTVTPVDIDPLQPVPNTGISMSPSIAPSIPPRGPMQSVDAASGQLESTELRDTLPHDIGSEVEESPREIVRRGTIRFAEGIQSVFKRRDTVTSNNSEAVSLGSMSGASNIGGDVFTESPELAMAERRESVAMSPLDKRPSTSSLQQRLRSESKVSITPSITFTTADPTPTPMRQTSGSRISFATQTELGRSGSTSRPSMPHRGSLSQGSVNLPATSSLGIPPTANSIRSASGFSNHSGRSRLTSISQPMTSAQQAVLREVMEEEKRELEKAKHEEEEYHDKEFNELKKERGRSISVGSSVPEISEESPESSTSPRRRSSTRRVSRSTSQISNLSIESGATPRMRRQSAHPTSPSPEPSRISTAGVTLLAANRLMGGVVNRRRGMSIATTHSARLPSMMEDDQNNDSDDVSPISAGAEPRGRRPTMIELQNAAPRATSVNSDSMQRGVASSGNVAGWGDQM